MCMSVLLAYTCACHIGTWCHQGSEGLGAPGTGVVVNCLVVLVEGLSLGRLKRDQTMLTSELSPAAHMLMLVPAVLTVFWWLYFFSCNFLFKKLISKNNILGFVRTFSNKFILVHSPPLFFSIPFYPLLMVTFHFLVSSPTLNPSLVSYPHTPHSHSYLQT